MASFRELSFLVRSVNFSKISMVEKLYIDINHLKMICKIRVLTKIASDRVLVIERKLKISHSNLLF